MPCRAWSDERDENATIAPGTHLALVAGFGSPLGPTATAELLQGWGVDVVDQSERARGLLGVLVQVHAGTRGGKLSLGVGASANVRSEDFDGTLTAALKASLVRTWGSPKVTENRHTYLGPELQISAQRVDVSFGVLARLHGSERSRILFAWGAGIRF
jgi:hypothetical protein